MDFFDFVGRLVFVCLRVFDLAATRFELFFDLERIPVMFEHSRHGERSSCILAG